jgi:hypothetical protein
VDLYSATQTAVPLLTQFVLKLVGAHYRQVYFDTNRPIRETFGAAGFPAPEQRVLVRSRS